MIIVCTASPAAVCLLVALAVQRRRSPSSACSSARSPTRCRKIALDALIQRDVVETLRSSAFARSETFLQLAWVLGAAIAVALPVHHGGYLGFLVAGIVVGLVAVFTLLRHRAAGRTPAQRPGTA